MRAVARIPSLTIIVIVLAKRSKQLGILFILFLGKIIHTAAYLNLLVKYVENVSRVKFILVEKPFSSRLKFRDKICFFVSVFV